MLTRKPRKSRPSTFREPAPVEAPRLPDLDAGAAYHGDRMGGDFYDFVIAGRRLIFTLVDISGRRPRAQHIAAAVQDEFRNAVPKLFSAATVNEALAMVELSLLLNRTVLQTANGVCHSPAFLGCFNPELGTVCYSNAGHVPGLIRDDSGIRELPATGLPFGLFSHATHDAPMSALAPGASLLLVSRGVLEGRCKGDEFGMEGVRETFRQAKAPTANRICVEILDGVTRFMCAPPTHNDVTALALLRPGA